MRCSEGKEDTNEVKANTHEKAQEKQLSSLFFTQSSNRVGCRKILALMP